MQLNWICKANLKTQYLGLLIIMGSGIYSCSSFEGSTYDPGESEKADQTSTEDSPSETQVTSGIPACIETYITDSGQTISTIPDLDSSLADFKSKTKITSLDELNDLTDLIFRATVTASEGLVDYAALKGDLKTHWALLNSGLEAIEPPTGSSKEKTAYWINAYNVVMIQHVLTNDLSDISKKFDVFKEEVTVGTHKLSLDKIEKGILGLGGRSEDHPSDLTIETIDPRLHFALVCAALSCPKIRNFAYRASNIEETLNQNQLIFFNSSTYLSSNDDGSIKVSSLFDWFAIDFNLLADGEDGASRRSLIESQVIDSCRSDKTNLADEFEAKAFSELSTLSYDWSVNSK